MFQAEFQQAANLLKLSFFGRAGAQEAAACAKEVETLLGNAQPGFRLLTDLSQLEVMDLAWVPFLKKTMDLCNQKGIATVVRVIPDPQKDIGLNILSLFHYERRVRIMTCENLDEAMKLLAG